MFMHYESHILRMSEDLPPQYGIHAIWVGMLKAMPNYICKPRMLDDYYLLYISDGGGSYRTKGQEYELKKRRFVLFISWGGSPLIQNR